VVLLSIDTLRFDHLGCYGYPRDITPNLDAFRRDAVLFEQAIAQAPSTLASHASMLTGRIPPHHGASYARKQKLGSSVRTLAEALKAAGYATASINNGGQLDASFGLDRGFDVYRSPQRVFLHFVARRGLQWLNEHPSPAFLFLHTYQVHHPYTPEPRFLERLNTGYQGSLPDKTSIRLLRRINRGELQIDERDRQHIIDTYDAEILSMDEAFGRFIADLKAQGRYENTLILVTSDHGEEFGEHGQMGWHSHTLYDELLRVPLLIKLPENRHAGDTVTPQVRLLDLPATILDLLNLPPEESFDGTSLLPLIDREEEPPRPAMSAMDLPAGEVIYSLRTADWKLYQRQLFHLEEDPGEQINIIEDHRRQWHGLNQTLGEIVNARPEAHAEDAAVSEETRERLRALGYVE
jgi:arylsulfatase A-like enzyme